MNNEHIESRYYAFLYGDNLWTSVPISSREISNKYKYITITMGECDLLLPSSEITCLCDEDSSEVLKCFLTSEAVMVQDMVNIDTGLELGAASTHNTLNTGQLLQVLHSTNIFSYSKIIFLNLKNIFFHFSYFNFFHFWVENFGLYIKLTHRFCQNNNFYEIQNEAVKSRPK